MLDAGSKQDSEIDFDSLLLEMVALEELARLPDPDYRTVQYSSFDRRSRRI